MKLYRLHARQALPIPKEEAWKFLSDPKNLGIITPKDLKLQLITEEDKAMFAGQILPYSVTPLAGLKMKWVTEITHVTEGSYFVDEQRFGPYALWHHKHFLEIIPEGVIMEDIIDYKLPFGVLGQWVHNIIVAKKLQEIFGYRERVLVEKFGKVPHIPSQLLIKTI